MRSKHVHAWWGVPARSPTESDNSRCQIKKHGRRRGVQPFEVPRSHQEDVKTQHKDVAAGTYITRDRYGRIGLSPIRPLVDNDRLWPLV
jgi:hypothetical protein